MIRKEDLGYATIPALVTCIMFFQTEFMEISEMYPYVFGSVILGSTLQAMFAEGKDYTPVCYMSFGLAYGIWVLAAAIMLAVPTMGISFLFMVFPIKSIILLTGMTMGLAFVQKLQDRMNGKQP